MEAPTRTPQMIGQSLIEMLVTLSLLTGVALGALKVFKASWERLNCQRIAFVSAHQALLGNTSAYLIQARVTEGPDSVTSQAHCGSAFERVGFRKLEANP
mgnify:CR=1 FL=1